MQAFGINTGEGTGFARFSGLFMSHPALVARIAALKAARSA
jgi:Zn-dependent protease with chaperone function